MTATGDLEATDTARLPLLGVRVLELSHSAAAVGGRILADLGLNPELAPVVWEPTL